MISASIIILTKNAGIGFDRLLKRVFSQKFEGEFEVIVIDSGSMDGTLKISKEYGTKVFQIFPNEFHHGKTRNLGARLARGDFLVYLTQDALPLNDNWLQTLLDNFEENEVVAVYGRQIAWRDTLPPERFFYEYYFPSHRMCIEYNGKTLSSKSNVFVSNVNSAIRKNTWREYSFSEIISMAEDKDFARQILVAGYKIVYDSKACVYHSHNFGLLTAFRRFFDYGVASAKNASKSPAANVAAPLKRVLEYFLSEVKYLHQNGEDAWIIYSLVYEISKLMGYFSGLHEKFLPSFLRSRFSEMNCNKKNKPSHLRQLSKV